MLFSWLGKEIEDGQIIDWGCVFGLGSFMVRESDSGLANYRSGVRV